MLAHFITITNLAPIIVVVFVIALTILIILLRTVSNRHYNIYEFLRKTSPPSWTRR